MTEGKTLTYRLDYLNKENLYKKIQDYLHSLDNDYCINRVSHGDIFAHRNTTLGSNGSNVYLYLLVKFIDLFESSTDTSKYSDDELIEILRMVKVVYDIQIAKNVIITIGSKELPSFSKEEYNENVSNFVKGCIDMFLTVILKYK